MRELLHKPGARSRLLGLVPALPLTAAVFAFNMACGPLCNLNDIGDFRTRALFTAMAAFVHLSLLVGAALLCAQGARRAALRQIIVTFGFLLCMLAINQKTYAYVRVAQPVVRAMDTRGLAAAAGADIDLSAPSLMLLYLISRGPVYDMYLVKLFASACSLALAIAVARAADELKLGLRAEAAMTLAVILPQSFMSAACAAQFEHLSALLLALSLLLLAGEKRRPLGGALCFGAAFAVSGAALYALPAYLYLIKGKRMRARHLAAGLLLALALCVPAALSGMGLPAAAASLLRANAGLPRFASGAPNLMNLFPRASVEEIPEYPALRSLAVDAVTNAQPYYTPEHMAIAMRALTALGLALLLGAWALCARGRMSPLRRALALTLTALFICPAASSSAWLAADALCVLALLAEPGLRPAACLALLATACSGAYPVAGETVVPMIASAALAFLAALLALGVLPGKGEADA